MRSAPALSRLVCSLAGCWLVVCSLAGRGADNDPEQFEERMFSRSTERMVRALKSDRGLWIKELEAAFPDKVVHATTDEEYAKWFVLLAGKNDEWRRATAPNERIAELFDRITQRLELGPVPSIRREEFAKYARKVLSAGNPPAAGQQSPDAEDADRVFRVLDKDGDGSLSKEEMTPRLLDDRAATDADANGRIDKTEYREFFRRRTLMLAETASGLKADEVKPGEGKPGELKPSEAKPGPNAKMAGLPPWFTTFDTDKDNQVALSEWRKAGRSIAAFMEMDLDGDGLLTRDEYLRYVRMNEKKTPPDMPPMPPNNRAGKN